MPEVDEYISVPNNYEYRKIQALTTEDINQLTDLDIKQYARMKTEKVLETQFRFSSSSTGIVTAVRQVVKDNTYFQNPHPKMTKTKPQQTFSLYISDGTPLCDFDYVNHIPASKRRQKYYQAGRMSQRSSFIPSPVFDIQQAIRNTCSFAPAVSVPT